MSNLTRDELKQVIKEAVREAIQDVFAGIGSRSRSSWRQSGAAGSSSPQPQRPPYVYDAEGKPKEAPVAGPQDKPEWIRPRDIKTHFGISRSMAYDLIEQGKIVSKVIRKRGNLTGIRLISYDSVKAFIESQQNDGPEQQT